MRIQGIVILLAVIISLAIGAFIFLGQNSPAPSSSKEASTPLVRDDGRYVEYSKAALDKTKEKRRVLFFYASWCPICRPANMSFKENVAKIPDDVVLIRVNYNDPDTDSEEKDLAKKYGVVYQHTFIQIDQNGNEVVKWNGGEIDELLERLL